MKEKGAVRCFRSSEKREQRRENEKEIKAKWGGTLKGRENDREG